VGERTKESPEGRTDDGKTGMIVDIIGVIFLRCLLFFHFYLFGVSWPFLGSADYTPDEFMFTVYQT
jgi:hypothetical protein